MRVLITGGLSYIGINTAKEFIDQGHDVVLYDISSRQSAYLESFYDPKRIKIVRGDVTNFSHVLSTVREHRPDALAHLVTMLSEEDCRNFPTEAMRLGVNGTQTMLEAARLEGVSRFIYVSTGGVFGERPAHVPLVEDDRPDPRGMYALFKYLAEELTRRYRTIYGMSAAVARISYVFGPDAITPEMMLTRGPIPYFLYKALQGEAVHESSGGDFFASHSYVRDIAGGIFAACTAKELKSDLYHIGSGENYSMRDVIAEINRVTGSNHSIAAGTQAHFAQTPMRGALSVARAEREIGFKVRYPLPKAIEDYARWMRETLKNAP